jgi:hypothetical protein
MPQYVLVLDTHAMDNIPDEDMPDVDKAAHAVSQEAIDAGGGCAAVDWKTRGQASWPPTGRSPTAHRLSREEAHKWAAKWAAACRCDQEIWELGFDPKIDAMLRQADNRKSRPDDA